MVHCVQSETFAAIDHNCRHLLVVVHNDGYRLNAMADHKMMMVGHMKTLTVRMMTKEVRMRTKEVHMKTMEDRKMKMAAIHNHWTSHSISVGHIHLKLVVHIRLLAARMSTQDLTICYYLCNLHELQTQLEIKCLQIQFSWQVLNQF